jgi:hypothetical protein
MADINVHHAVIATMITGIDEAFFDADFEGAEMLVEQLRAYLETDMRDHLEDDFLQAGSWLTPNLPSSVDIPLNPPMIDGPAALPPAWPLPRLWPPTGLDKADAAFIKFLVNGDIGLDANDDVMLPSGRMATAAEMNEWIATFKRAQNPWST